jgi:pyruvate dehydrogenase E1 component alpha subunit
MSDPGLYRTREEVSEWKKRDPVAIARQRLLDIGASEDEIKKVEAAVKDEITDAIRFAEESPLADEYLSYVYKE